MTDIYLQVRTKYYEHSIFAMLNFNDFHFYFMGTTEEMTLYCSGGYHPIIVGDILGWEVMRGVIES